MYVSCSVSDFFPIGVTALVFTGICILHVTTCSKPSFYITYPDFAVDFAFSLCIVHAGHHGPTNAVFAAVSLRYDWATWPHKTYVEPWYWITHRQSASWIRRWDPWTSDTSDRRPNLNLTRPQRPMSTVFWALHFLHSTELHRFFVEFAGIDKRVCLGSQK